LKKKHLRKRQRLPPRDSKGTARKKPKEGWKGEGKESLSSETGYASRENARMLRRQGGKREIVLFGTGVLKKGTDIVVPKKVWVGGAAEDREKKKNLLVGGAKKGGETKECGKVSI